MKPKLPALALSCLCAVVAAQEAPQPPQPQANSNAPRQPRQRLTLDGSGNTESALDENLQITVRGALVKGTAMNVVLTGSGPRFDVKLLDPDVRMEMVVRKTGEKYSLSYSISTQVLVQQTPPAENAPPRPSPGYYRDLSLSGNVFTELGKPVKVISVGDQQLSITLAKAPTEKE